MSFLRFCPVFYCDRLQYPMLKIGALSLKYPFVLAPMAGITDLPYRMICRRFGCELAFVEMTSAKALVYENRKTEKMVATRPDDRPLGIQLLGTEQEFILRALDIIQKYEYDIIDFNAACPVTKVTSKGEGSGMMKEPRKLGLLLKAIVDHTDTPVTVKIRATATMYPEVMRNGLSCMRFLLLPLSQREVARRRRGRGEFAERSWRNCGGRRP